MKAMMAPRGGGKTAAMLAWMRAAPEGEHRVCVCFSAQEAMRLLRENPDLASWKFVGPDDGRSAGAWSGVLAGHGGRIVLGYDNLDIWLQSRTGHEVGMVTLNEDAPRPYGIKATP